MSAQKYQWERFWCPSSGTFSLDGDGFLEDPESPAGRFTNPAVVALETLSRVPCLVLLGEPGIGKSTALEEMRISAEASQPDCVFSLDLAGYGDEGRLHRDLFESGSFFDWSDPPTEPEIFLDSLDECLLRIDTVARLLAQGLLRRPHLQSRFLIACRTAVWPASLESALKEVWGESNVSVYELLPLRRADVEQAASANGISPDEFLGAVVEAGVGPLASRPITLKLLLGIYQQQSQLPGSRWELYEQGCLALCEESNPSRREKGRFGRLGNRQRLAVASRMGAITVFANRPAIWTGIASAEASNDCSVADLAGVSESAGGTLFEVAENDIREVLDTGLFSSRGGERMGWSHRTFGEFLAARYLIEHNVTEAQIPGLLFEVSSGEGQLIPQLQEPTAWLATKLDWLRRKLVKQDPESLLTSDAGLPDAAAISELVAALLQRAFAGELSFDALHPRTRRRALTHPGLAEQLKPSISDKSISRYARNFAIDIAEDCRVEQLGHDLVQIALDGDEDYVVRVNAAWATTRVASASERSELRPLLRLGPQDEPDGELRGCALIALWPDQLPLREVLDALDSPPRANLFGAYWLFVHERFVPGIAADDIPVALDWLSRQPQRRAMHEHLESLIEQILVRAWQHSERPAVLSALAKTVFARLRTEHDLSDRGSDKVLRGLIENDTGTRRRLLERAVSDTDDPEKDLELLAFSDDPLVVPDDVPWLVEKAQAAGPDLGRRWAKLARYSFRVDEPDQVNLILEAAVTRKVQVIEDEFAEWLQPVRLDSPKADELRERRRRWEGLMTGARSPEPLDPPLHVRLAEVLAAIEGGRPDLFVNALGLLAVDPDDARDQAYGAHVDITELPGWRIVDPATEERITKAAVTFLSQGNPPSDEWLDTGQMPFKAIAGYQALRFLLTRRRRQLQELDVGVWRKWMVTLLAVPTTSVEDRAPDNELSRIAYEAAPKSLLAALRKVIRADATKHGHIFVLDRIEHLFDAAVGVLLLDEIENGTYKPESLMQLLGTALSLNLPEASEVAGSIVELRSSSQGGDQERAVAAGAALMLDADDCGWPIVWPHIERDSEYGRAVMAEVSDKNEWRRRGVADRLAEEHMADLYVWLEKQFPAKEDPDLSKARMLGTRDSIGHLRSGVLEALRRRGTDAAAEALERIADTFPDRGWYRPFVAEARRLAIATTWRPPDPADIIALSSDPGTRLVRSGDELQGVLLESLARLESELQGETPAAPDLWNQIKRGASRPKDEPALSDYVKRFLDRDLQSRGVIVNREVEIRRGEGTGRGELTDLHVDAVARAALSDVVDKVTVIIEVKGCWNRELFTAMESQLVDRYMKDNKCQHGIYLVGCFHCPEWDTADRRYKEAKHQGADEIRTPLAEQAAELSAGSTSVKAYVLNTSLR